MNDSNILAFLKEKVSLFGDFPDQRLAGLLDGELALVTDDKVTADLLAETTRNADHE